MDIVIRRVQPGDMPRLSDFYEALSPESLRARFLAVTRGIAGMAARSFCSLDHMHDEGFVALERGTDGGDDQIVGHVCLAQVGPDRVELGIAVADTFQGRGIGRRLFESALKWTRDRGFHTIVASCFADNSRVLKLLTSAPHTGRITPAQSGVVDVEIPLFGSLPRPAFHYPPESRRPWRFSRSRRPSGVSPRTRPPAPAAAD